MVVVAAITATVGRRRRSGGRVHRHGNQLAEHGGAEPVGDGLAWPGCPGAPAGDASGRGRRAAAGVAARWGRAADLGSVPLLVVPVWPRPQRCSRAKLRPGSSGLHGVWRRSGGRVLRKVGGRRNGRRAAGEGLAPAGKVNPGERPEGRGADATQRATLGQRKGAAAASARTTAASRARSAACRQPVLGPRRRHNLALQLLVRHPDVLPPFGKEIHYFELHTPEGPWYRGRFPTSTGCGAAPDVDASPYYLMHPQAPDERGAPAGRKARRPAQQSGGPTFCTIS